MMAVNINETFPNATLTDEDGSKKTLRELNDNDYLVLFFYPKDFTTICTKEACMFRDAYQDFLDNGANLIGISGDDNESHKNFKERYNLPYRLFTDENNELRKRLGIKKTLGLIQGRETFILNKELKLIHRFNSQFNAEKHVQEALKVIKADYLCSFNEIDCV